jgi:hypothetical protein
LAGSLHGRVVNLVGVGIAGAQLQMMHLTGERSDDRVAMSDDAGAFVFPVLAPGLYELSVRRIGFKPVFTQVQIASDDILLNVRMDAAVQRLDTMRTDADAMPEQYGRSLRMAEFYERRQLGNGHFFTREDIDASAASSPADLIRRVAGMRTYIGNGSIVVKSTGCVGTGLISNFGPDTSATRSGGGSIGSSSPDGWGNVALYIDGVIVPPGYRNQELASLSPVQIEAMEVYQSPSELPPEAVGNACAAVYVWTRIGS